MVEIKKKFSGLSGYVLKIIAVVAMLTDHIAYGLLDFYNPLALAMHIIGRLTIPIMCYFVAEGLRHTKNLKKYMLRMLICGIVSIIPFYMFFGEMYGYRQNIIFDLLIGLAAAASIDSKKLKKWQKVLCVASLTALSMFVGGWPIIPMAFILVFYFIRDFKKQAIWISGITLWLVLSVTVFCLLNAKLHFSSYDWVWYDKLYLLGFVLALPLLRLYNGKRGGNGSNGRIFYIIYPLHLLVFALLFNYRFSIHTIYIGINIIAILCVIMLLEEARRAKNSAPHAAMLLFLSTELMFNFGFVLEITSSTLDAIILAIKLEYFGQCGVIIAYTWFIDQFCKLKLPKIVYSIEYVISAVSLLAVFTIEFNSLFYTSISMDETGAFPHVDVSPGPVFVLFYFIFASVFLAAVIICAVKYRQSHGIEKERIKLILIGSICPWVEMVMKVLGLTGGYDFICLGILSALFFFTFALIKYGYFNSIQAANENALNHGNEGILVVNYEHRVLFFNNIISSVFPNIKENIDIYTVDSFKSFFEGDMRNIKIGDRIYEIRIDSLVECGYVQGYMLWAIDMTDHYNNLELMQNRAENDALTGLNNRSCFEAKLSEYLLQHRQGTMVMFDMDNFKYVNDHFGHGAGDKVLILFADILKSLTNDNDIKCRIGGDEFCGFIADITDTEMLSEISEKIISDFAERLKENNLPTITTVSIGLAVYDGSYTEKFSTLYGNADKALYVSKNSGKNGYNFYNAQLAVHKQ